MRLVLSEGPLNVPHINMKKKKYTSSFSNVSELSGAIFREAEHEERLEFSKAKTLKQDMT